MDYPGPYTPNHQANSFACYYRALQPLNFSNDIIYPTGPRASNCLPGYHAHNGLCKNDAQTRLLLDDSNEVQETKAHLRGVKNNLTLSFN